MPVFFLCFCLFCFCVFLAYLRSVLCVCDFSVTSHTHVKLPKTVFFSFCVCVFWGKNCLSLRDFSRPEVKSTSTSTSTSLGKVNVIQPSFKPRPKSLRAPKGPFPGPKWVLTSEDNTQRLSVVGKPPSKYDNRRCDFTGCPAGVPFIYYATPHRNRAYAYRRLLLSAQHDIEVSNVIPQACVCAV